MPCIWFLHFPTQYSILIETKKSCFNVFFTLFDWIERKKKIFVLFSHPFFSQTINQSMKVSVLYTYALPPKKPSVYPSKTRSFARGGDNGAQALAVALRQNKVTHHPDSSLSYSSSSLHTDTHRTLPWRESNRSKWGTSSSRCITREQGDPSSRFISLICIFFSSHRHSPHSTSGIIKSETMGHKL